MSVTEGGPGTKTAPGGPNTPPSADGTPGAPNQVSSATPRAYNQEEVDGLTHSARSQGGREATAALKVMTSDRDSLKIQLTSKEGEITDITADRDAHRTTAEDLASEDPQRFNLVKRETTLRTGEAALNTGKRQLEAATATLAADRKLTDDSKREITVMDVATGKKDAAGTVIGSPEKLKEVCESIGATTEEQIQTVADTLWPDAVTTAVPALKILSGTTSGGAPSLDGKSPEEKVKLGLAKLNKT